jgi:hypothetical protein
MINTMQVDRGAALARAWRRVFEDALRHVLGPTRIPSFEHMHAVHAALKTA